MRRRQNQRMWIDRRPLFVNRFDEATKIGDVERIGPCRLPADHAVEAVVVGQRVLVDAVELLVDQIGGIVWLPEFGRIEFGEGCAELHPNACSFKLSGDLVVAALLADRRAIACTALLRSCRADKLALRGKRKSYQHLRKG